MRKKDLGHIVKVSEDTFAMSEIIPNTGIMLCVLFLIIFYLKLLLAIAIKT